VDGSTLVVDSQGALAWSVAQWAVANAKDLSVVRVEVEGHTWQRASGDGWQVTGSPDGQVHITVRTADGGS